MNSYWTIFIGPIYWTNFSEMSGKMRIMCESTLSSTVPHIVGIFRICLGCMNGKCMNYGASVVF